MTEIEYPVAGIKRSGSLSLTNLMYCKFSCRWAETGKTFWYSEGATFHE